MTPAELTTRARALLCDILAPWGEIRIEPTGGGCEVMAIDLAKASGYAVFLTDAEDASIETFGPYVLGLYHRPTCETLGSYDAPGRLDTFELVPIEGLVEAFTDLEDEALVHSQDPTARAALEAAALQL